MTKIFNNISNYADILAIPMFALFIFYFYNIENKNSIENILFLFSIIGLTLDVVFTYIFLIVDK